MSVRPAQKHSFSEDGDERQRQGVLRYVELATWFRRRIELGEWAHGTRIPTVIELAATCGVARETIRQALDIIHREGLIERHRAKGTFVSGFPREQLWCELQTSYFGLLQTREGVRIEILSEARDVEIAEPLDIGNPAGLYRRFERRHWRKDEPYLLTEVFVAEAMVDRIPRKAFSTETAMKILAHIPEVEAKRIEQILTIGAADMETAGKLRLPLNAPVAHVNRYALDEADDILIFSRGTYRGEIVRLTINVR